MLCENKDPEELTFRVFELFADGREYDTGKTFSVNKQESYKFTNKFGITRYTNKIEDNGILLAMFHKVYGFDVGLNGFYLSWEPEPKTGKYSMFDTGVITWRTGCWRIKRVK